MIYDRPRPITFYMTSVEKHNRERILSGEIGCIFAVIPNTKKHRTIKQASELRFVKFIVNPYNGVQFHAVILSQKKLFVKLDICRREAAPSHLRGCPNENASHSH